MACPPASMSTDVLFWNDVEKQCERQTTTTTNGVEGQPVVTPETQNLCC